MASGPVFSERSAGVRPMLWPPADRARRRPPAAASNDAAARAGVPPWMAASHLLPHLAAALQLALGVRLRLRAAPAGEDLGDDAGDALSLGGVDVGEGRLLIVMGAEAAMALMAMAFGGNRAGAAAETLPWSDLAPGNAGWLALGTLLRQASARALAEAGAEVVRAMLPSLADLATSGARRLPLALSASGRTVRLALHFLPAPAASPAAPDPAPADRPGPDPWARGLDALSRTVPVPVALELSTQQLPLARVMALGVGDVIALPPVRSVQLRVSGAPWAEVPLGALGATTGEVSNTEGPGINGPNTLGEANR